MLTVQNLSFSYSEKQVLEKLSFNLNAGQMLHLKGANGAGKSTLLKLIAGLLYPESGDIQYSGQSIFADLALYHQNMIYIGHKPGVNGLLTLKEHFKFTCTKDEYARVNSKLLIQYGLDRLSDMPCGLLSAGQRRRVALLKLAVTKARLWVLDEPLVSLDDDAVNRLLSCLEVHLKNGGAIVLSSHQLVQLPNLNYQEYAL